MNTPEFAKGKIAQAYGMPKDLMEFPASSNDSASSELSSPADSSCLQPRNISLSHHDSLLTVDWHTAPNGYQIVLCREHQDIESQIAINPPARFSMTGLPAGSYCAKVYVNDLNSSEQEGDSCTPAIVKLEPPSDIALSYDRTTQAIKVNWRDVPGAIAYQVQLIAVLNPAESLTTDKQFEIDAAFVTQPARSYRAWVQAKGDAQHIDSEIGQSQTLLSLLSAPTNLTQSYSIETKSFGATWDSVPEAIGYVVQLVNLDANSQIIGQQQIDRSQTSFTFDMLQVFEGGAGAYQIWIKAIGNPQFIDSQFSRPNSSMPRLAAPNLTQQAEMGEKLRTLLWANWQAVPAATGYLAQVVEVSQNKVMVERQLPAIATDVASLRDLTPFQFDVQDFLGDQEARYQLRVKALGDAQHLDSSFAQAAPPIKRLATPAQVTLAATPTTLSANWQAVPGAAKYYAQVINLNQNNAVVLDRFIVSQPQQPLIVSFEVEQFLKGKPAANYQIWVSAIGPEDDTQTLASAFGKPANSIPLADTANPANPVDLTPPTGNQPAQTAVKQLTDSTQASLEAIQTATDDAHNALQKAIAALALATDATRSPAQAAVDANTSVDQAIQGVKTAVIEANSAAQALAQQLTVGAAEAAAVAAKAALSKGADSTFGMAAASRANFDAEAAAVDSPAKEAATQAREATTKTQFSLQAAVQAIKSAADAADQAAKAVSSPTQPTA